MASLGLELGNRETSTFRTLKSVSAGAEIKPSVLIRALAAHADTKPIFTPDWREKYAHALDEGLSDGEIQRVLGLDGDAGKDLDVIYHDVKDQFTHPFALRVGKIYTRIGNGGVAFEKYSENKAFPQEHQFLIPYFQKIDGFTDFAVVVMAALNKGVPKYGLDMTGVNASIFENCRRVGNKGNSEIIPAALRIQLAIVNSVFEQVINSKTKS
jgi:hypothetical protein